MHKNVSVNYAVLVAEHRADRLQLEVVVRAVGEAHVGRRDGLEEGGFFARPSRPHLEDDVVELGEARRGRVAFQGQGIDQPRTFPSNCSP